MPNNQEKLAAYFSAARTLKLLTFLVVSGYRSIFPVIESLAVLLQNRVLYLPLLVPLLYDGYLVPYAEHL